MSIKIAPINDVNAHQWDDLAAAVGAGYFQCHAEVVYYSVCAGAAPFFARVLDERGNGIGVVAAAVVRSNLWPFSQYCNWAMLPSLPVAADASAETERAILVALEEHLRHQGFFSVRIDSYDSVRSETVLSSLGYDLSSRSEFYIDLNPSLDDIWSKFKGHRRTDIRKAEKVGVQTRIENTNEGLERVMSFQAESMQRRDVMINQTPISIVDARQKQLESGNADIFVSYQGGTPINASLFGVFNNKPYYHVSGASDFGYRCCGPAHLIWTAIKIYKERGATCLNLGAALEDQTGLFRFKKDFGATVVSQPIGTKRISVTGSALHRIRSILRP